MEITVEQAMQAMNQWAQERRVNRADYRIEKLLRATHDILQKPDGLHLDETFVNADLLRALPDMSLERGC